MSGKRLNLAKTPSQLALLSNSLIALVRSPRGRARTTGKQLTIGRVLTLEISIPVKKPLAHNAAKMMTQQHDIVNTKNRKDLAWKNPIIFGIMGKIELKPMGTMHAQLNQAQ